MPKKLLDKMGINVFHNNTTSPWVRSQMERAVNFADMAGIKYIRPAFNLQTDEFNGTYNNWREYYYKLFQQHNLMPIIGAYPQQLNGHLLDSNADDLVDQAVRAYAIIMDGLLKCGVNEFIVEAWNETDGKFAADQNTAQTNDTVIDRYLTFNMKLCEETHKRGMKFMDLCSIQYAQSPTLQHVLSKYNDKLASYSQKPDWISFHPYCERYGENFFPESHLILMNYSNFSNMNGIPQAVSEFGYPSEDWGSPFSGQWSSQYSRDVMLRQIMVMDYMNVDPMVIYSCNTNPDPADADSDDCWGAYQYSKSDGSIRLSKLGAVELKFFQDMKGYYQTAFNLKLADSSTSISSTHQLECANYWVEYSNDNGDKKLFYWNPFANRDGKINWQGTDYNLHFTQHVKCIEKKK